MPDNRITQAEMMEMFGERIPIEAVNLLWDSPGDWTIKQVRERLRVIAAEKKRHPVLGRRN